MNIRRCKPGDEENWIALNREFMLFEIQEDSPWNGTEKTPDSVFKKTFQTALQNPELITLFMIEEKNNMPIGFANLMTIFSVWAHGKALILDDLYIKKEYQSRGYGRTAMEFIEKYAKGNHYKRLQFQSESTNPNAKKFYQALGFTAKDMFFYVRYL